VLDVLDVAEEAAGWRGRGGTVLRRQLARAWGGREAGWAGGTSGTGRACGAESDDGLAARSGLAARGDDGLAARSSGARTG